MPSRTTEQKFSDIPGEKDHVCDVGCIGVAIYNKDDDKISTLHIAPTA